MVHPYYTAESLLFGAIGVFDLAMGLYQMYVWRQYAKNEVLLIHRLCHPAMVLQGIIIIAWNVDTQGVFGRYPAWLITAFNSLVLIVFFFP